MLILIGSDSILYEILTSGKCTLIHSGVFRASRKGPRSCGYIINMSFIINSTSTDIGFSSEMKQRRKNWHKCIFV